MPLRQRGPRPEAPARYGAPHNVIAHPLLVLWPRLGHWLHRHNAVTHEGVKHRPALRDPDGGAWCSWLNLPELAGLRAQLNAGARALMRDDAIARLAVAMDVPPELLDTPKALGPLWPTPAPSFPNIGTASAERRAADVLARLVDLKDGPRDDAYRAAKDAAWTEARIAVDLVTAFRSSRLTVGVDFGAAGEPVVVATDDAGRTTTVDHEFAGDRRCSTKAPHDAHDWWDEHEIDPSRFRCSGVDDAGHPNGGTWPTTPEPEAPHRLAHPEFYEPFMVVTTEDRDDLYGVLHAIRETLCLAGHHVPPTQAHDRGGPGAGTTNIGQVIVQTAPASSRPSEHVEAEVARRAVRDRPQA